MAKTNKELQKLKRQDLLELLLGQTREVGQLQDTIAEQAKTIAELTELSERLKSRLNEKDDQIEGLKEKLNSKDDQIGKLKSRLDKKDEKIERLREGGRIKADAEISLDLEELFDVAEHAASLYLKEKLAEKGMIEPFSQEEDEEDEANDAEEAEASTEEEEEEVPGDGEGFPGAPEEGAEPVDESNGEG